MEYQIIKVEKKNTSLYSLCKNEYNSNTETMTALDFEYGDFEGYCSHVMKNTKIDLENGEKVTSLKIGREINLFIPIDVTQEVLGKPNRNIEKSPSKLRKF